MPPASKRGERFSAAPQRPDRPRHPRAPAKRRRSAGEVGSSPSFICVLRGKRQGKLGHHLLMLMRGSQLAMVKRPAFAADGRLAVTQDPQGNYWYLLHGELAGSSFDMQQTHQLITTLNTLEKDLKRVTRRRSCFRAARCFTAITPANRRSRISQPWAWQRCWGESPLWRCSAFVPVAASRDFHRHRRAGGNGRHFIDFR